MPGFKDDAPEAAPDSLQISLLESGKMVTGMTDSGPLRMRTVGPGKKSGGSVSFDAKHACTITLYRPDGPRGAGYYHRSAELSYPDSVLARADGKTTQLTGRFRVEAVPHQSNINALLRCRLPAVDGAERRVQRFFRFGPEQLDASGFAPSDSTTDSTGVESVPRLASTPTPKELECDEVRVCQGGECVTYEGTSCFGGGGGGIGGPGLGGLPGGGGCASGCDIPEFYPRDVNGGPTDDPNSPPCESDDPPDYCDEAGSCHEKEFENDLDGKILRGLEDTGALNELWKKSNADAADQSKREERGGWIVSTDNGYRLVEFHEAESDITYTPVGVRGIDTGNRPSGTIATIHTHPFEPNETIKDTEVIRQLMEADEEYDPSNYDLSRLAEADAVDYPSEPSEGDFASSEDFQGYLIDGGTVYSYDGVNKIEGASERCGY